MSDSLDEKKPEILSTKILSSHGNCEMILEELELSSGVRYEYLYFFTDLRGVMVLAETKEGNYVINQEYRHPTKEFLFSLPGGCVDEGEDYAEAAARELYEETGYQSDELVYLGQSYPYPGRVGHETYYYLAKNAHKDSEANPETCEIFETSEMSLEEINKRMLEPSKVDGHVSSALYFKILRNL